MLCKICLPIFQNWTEDRVWRGDYHPDQASLAKSAAAGCIVCKDLLWHTTTKRAIDDVDLTSKSWYYRSTYLSKLPCIVFHIDGRITDRYYFLVPKSTFPANLTVADRKGVIPLSDSTAIVRKWMATCSRQHSRCSKHTNPTSYPTRLLEIQKSGVRLVLTKQKSVHGPYAALSYCWGPPPHNFLRLTASNMGPLQAGILDGQLPVAFREVIAFIRRLRIRYLWVDCLCIIQDGPGSKEDWLYESSRMHQVYSDCVLCLALDRAANPHESVLSGPIPEFAAPYEVNIRATGPECGGDAASHIVVPDWYFRNAYYGQPLSFRAWGFQEKFLPARVVGFGVTEMFWTCQELPFACESFPTGVAELTRHLVSDEDLSIPTSSNLYELCAKWFHIVYLYSFRTLTYPEKDKLVALSAVATRMGQAMTDENVEGHFWKTMIKSLYWSCCDIEWDSPLFRENWCRTTRRTYPTRNEDDTNFHRPPTWSWASVDGIVHFDKIFLDDDDKNSLSYEAGVLAHAVSYKVGSEARGVEPNQFPSVTLKLSSFVIEGVLKVKGDVDRTAPDFLRSPNAQIFFTTMLGSISNSIEHFRVWVDDLGIISPSEGAKAIFCPLFLTNKCREDGMITDCDCVKGLFIKETEMVQDGLVVYERAGCGMIQLKLGIKWADVAGNLDWQKREVVLG